MYNIIKLMILIFLMPVTTSGSYKKLKAPPHVHISTSITSATEKLGPLCFHSVSYQYQVNQVVWNQKNWLFLL